MKRIEDSLVLSASDLVGYLNCRHLTELDHSVAEGALSKPNAWDPLLQILLERGYIHELNFLERLKENGFEVVSIDGVEISIEAVSETLAAMKRGTEVIAQGALSHNQWTGRADILRRVEVPSKFGNWSYEVIDTKLARETKAGTILQLCLYSDLLMETQGTVPEYMYVVTPWSEYKPQRYRFSDFAAYFRKAKHNLLATLAEHRADTYPDPKDHCEICKWRNVCDRRRRDDDHLFLVAGISKLQINELNQHGITTLESLAKMPLPLEWKPDRGSVDSLNRIREQARIQFEAREAGEGKFEALPVENNFGFTCLPEPSNGDIFLDLEGDPFVGEHGLEYLFGYLCSEEEGTPPSVYKHHWALTRVDEKLSFEKFVDFVMDRWGSFPDLHIYHYAHYEPSAMKKLMGRYATREEEIDRMLRAGLFVDLYQVVRHSIRASVESYSIKHLEPFYRYERKVKLADANTALANFQANLELDDANSITEEIKKTVLGYNKDDCTSTFELREWLEKQREQLVVNGVSVSRPKYGGDAPSEKITDWLTKVNALVEKLIADIPIEQENRSREQHARWILANILDWHRREEKAVWWEFFRLAELSAEDLLEERAGLSGLTFIDSVGGSAIAPIHRYKFPPQETELRGGEDLRSLGGERFGKVEVVSIENCTVDIKKRRDTVVIHPSAVFAHSYVGTQVLADSLIRIGEYVAEHGLRGEGKYGAARDLLLRESPRIGGQELQREEETAVESAVRLCRYLTHGIFPIQGPPGAGKTFTGACMICELVMQGKTVGITANSHKVIRNLIDATIERACEMGVNARFCHKTSQVERPQSYLSIVTKNEEIIEGLERNISVGGGTAWLWARLEASEIVDVMFVDEAAQMSLANALAVSQAAKAMVLIGDPQQLDQPTQGSHPDGTNVSALDHILAGEQTISQEKGLFLKESWRLHPEISTYTSELFYEGKLSSKNGLDKQDIKSEGTICGSGLRYLPVDHHGNQNCSPEEAQAISKLVNDILKSNAVWTDREGQEQTVTFNDIVIITPYNAQVFEIQRQLPEARVGTVDKFQGQEAPIAIYSTATSSRADAPRGMEFLYSLNRFNVATSRARCLSIMVGSPQLFEAECRTPRQMQLANAFCRYIEVAEYIT